MIKSSVFGSYESAAKFTRERLGVKRLNSQQKKEVQGMVAKNIKRRKTKTRESISLIPKLKKQLTEELKAEIEEEFIKRYRHSTSRWAGGENTLAIRRDNVPFASGESSKGYSRNEKWSGTNAYFCINIQKGWRKEINSVPGLAFAGGMLTTHAQKVNDNCWRASWVVQKRGFALGVESGYIVRRENKFFHAKTASSALSLAKRSIASEKAETALSKLTCDELISRFGEVFVCRDDSLKVNCKTGTDHWIEKNMPGRVAATVEEVLTIDSSKAAIAACKVAILSFK